MLGLLKSVFNPAVVGNESIIRDTRFFFIFFILGSWLWMFFVSLYPLAQSPWTGFDDFLRLLGTCGLLSAASFISGGFIGCLFGIPRTLTSSLPAVTQATSEGVKLAPVTVQPNTNLEQISDWLTKVLVGVGLTQITELKSLVPRLGIYLEPAFAPLPAARIVGLSIIGAYTFAGFCFCYFESRTSLMRVFGDKDAP